MILPAISAANLHLCGRLDLVDHLGAMPTHSQDHLLTSQVRLALQMLQALAARENWRVPLDRCTSPFGGHGNQF